MEKKRKIQIIDTSLRDGSHAVSHSFTESQVSAVAGALDKVGVPFIELTHGDGIAGSSVNYGFSAVDEIDLLRAANKVIQKAKLTILVIPGIGMIDDMKKAMDAGVKAMRIATHCTEADVALQHVEFAKKSGMFTVGFLMMIGMASPEKLLEQAKIFESVGVDYINFADSAGYLLPDDVRARISVLKNGLSVPVGFHAHNNLGLAVGNSIAAVEEGADYIDATLRGLGAGAGNTQLEVFCAVLDRMGYETGIDLYVVMDAAEQAVEPIMHRPQKIDTSALMMGYAGVYSSFLLHTYRAAEKFAINPRDILVELGRRKMVGGQEDMIIDVAYELSRKK